MEETIVGPTQLVREDIETKTFKPIVPLMDPRISEALEKFGHKNVEFEQLAEFTGFSSREKQMLRVFLSPTFNDSHIYLAPEMIKDMGYSAPSAFYRDTLRKKYRENIDFIEVSATHQLVIAWEEANRDKSLLGKSTHTGTNRIQWRKNSGFTCLSSRLVATMSASQMMLKRDLMSISPASDPHGQRNISRRS